jgi:hypothetical protein
VSWDLRCEVTPPDYEPLWLERSVRSMQVGNSFEREQIRAGVDMAMTVISRRAELELPEATAFTVQLIGAEGGVTCMVHW